MEKDLKVTAEEIQNMTEEEWHAFREKSWLNKRAIYSQDMPEWYLRDRARFIQFIERANERSSNRRNNR